MGFDFTDIPADLFSAIDHANRVLGWQENLMDDEMPERWKWHLDWEIETHFELVKSARDKKYGSGADSSGEFENDGEDSVFSENAYASRFFD